MKTTVLLADDHNVMRTGIRSLLEKQESISVVGEADNGRDAVAVATELNPSVVLMDIGLPGLNGIEATRQITRQCKQTKVVILSMHADHHYIVNSLKAGASGYLLKDCSIDELLRAIRMVAGGKSYYSTDITGHVVSEYMGILNQEAPSATPLTNKEREVLQLLAEGYTTRKIAVTLSVSERTVESHRHQIMKKLGMHSVAELTRYAVREGIASL